MSVTSLYQISAHAKLNLFLKVLGKRPDGYHDILTLFQKISLADQLTIELTHHTGTKSNGIQISAEGWPVPQNETNLAYKAAAAFLQYTGIPCSVAIHLHKNIPSGAGMGGGSSDAAAVLLALNSLTDDLLPSVELMKIGASIGADVPFFISRQTSAIGSGTGTELKPITIERFWFVVVWPGFCISTKWVYDHFVLTNSGIHTNLLGADGLTAFLWQNDLEQAVMPSYPLLNDLKTRLISCGALHAMMTGSGSAVFGVFKTEEEANKTADALSIQLKDEKTYKPAEDNPVAWLVAPVTTL
jgi:4-diphosphocytidyl-2-C-methyl-D-erythritol kinase